jgi:hypothetical protein
MQQVFPHHLAVCADRFAPFRFQVSEILAVGVAADIASLVPHIEEKLGHVTELLVAPVGSNGGGGRPFRSRNSI